MSCNPETLARDVRYMKKLGYAAEEVWPVDMFPATVHVETVALLIPKQDKDSMFSNSGIEKKLWKEICDLAKQYDVDRVILFGSRARGDYKKVSDIDLAVSGGDVSGFSISVDEETSTLLQYDIVNLDGSVQEELREAIKKEGKVLYEKV